MIKAIETRRSIRRYKDKPVEEEKIKELIESARLAPSGDNTQPWNLIIVKSQEMREKLATASHNQKWMTQAPLFIVCIADIRSRIKYGELSIDESSDIPEVKQMIRDTAIAGEHIVLQAEDMGLGTCWIAWFTQKEIREVLGVPDDKYVLSIITVGYADEEPKMRPRKNTGDIVRYEKW